MHLFFEFETPWLLSFNLTSVGEERANMLPFTCNYRIRSIKRRVRLIVFKLL